MVTFGTYIQQIQFNGLSYAMGSVVDLLSSFNIIAQEFPFKKNPKAKDLPTRDWAGEDGVDVYVPSGALPVKHYDIEVTFLYVGTEQTMRTDLGNFIDFLYGRRKGANADTVQSARLAVFNEYTGIGRKDVVVSEVDNEVFYLTNADTDAVASLKVKFTVYDPVTDVTAVRNQSQVVTTLSFS